MNKKPLKPATTRGIFFWNMSGSVCNAANTVLMTLIITRICGADTAGIYSLSLAIAQVIGSVAYFEVRNFQVSDTQHEYTFSEYHLFRLLTFSAAACFTIVWTLWKGYTGEKLQTVFLCCLFQMIEAYEDVFQGLLQINNRLDLAGKSFTFRIISDTLLFWILLAVTKNFLFSLLVYTAYAGTWIFLVTIPWSDRFEKPHRTSLKNIPRLAYACLPIFLTNFLMSYIISAPKYALDEFYPSEMQTYFNILFMPAAVVNLFTFILYRIYITQMSKDWNSGNWKKFIRQILYILGWIALVGAGTLTVGWLAGVPFLSWFYGLPKLLGYRRELMVILAGGVLAAAAGWFNVVLTIIRRQKIQLIVNGVAAAACYFSVRPLVNCFGLMGASFSYLISMAILFFLQVILMAYFVRQRREQ